MQFENIRPGDVFRQCGTGCGLLIDLRDREEYARGHIPGAICLPYEEIRKNIPSLREWAEQSRKRYGRAALVVYCDRGNTSLRAARDLYNQGFYVKNVYGGISAYRGPLVKESKSVSLVDGMEKSR